MPDHYVCKLPHVRTSSPLFSCREKSGCSWVRFVQAYVQAAFASGCVHGGIHLSAAHALHSWGHGLTLTTQAPNKHKTNERELSFISRSPCLLYTHNATAGDRGTRLGGGDGDREKEAAVKSCLYVRLHETYPGAAALLLSGKQWTQLWSACAADRWMPPCLLRISSEILPKTHPEAKASSRSSPGRKTVDSMS